MFRNNFLIVLFALGACSDTPLGTPPAMTSIVATPERTAMVTYSLPNEIETASVFSGIARVVMDW